MTSAKRTVVVDLCEADDSNKQSYLSTWKKVSQCDINEYSLILIMNLINFIIFINILLVRVYLGEYESNTQRVSIRTII